MNPEEELRQALRHEAGMLPSPDPGAIKAISAAASRRRLKRLSGVAVACTFIVGVAGFATLRTNDAPSTTKVATRPGEPRPPDASSTTTAPAEADGDDVPDVAVGLSRKGRVVVLDPSTSRAVRVLAQYPTDGGRALRGISLSPDRGEVYFGYGADRGPCETGVYRVPVEGGRSPEKVADGLEPSLSPDGRLLAYATAAGRYGDPGPTTACSNVLVLRDMSTGKERTWLPTPDDGYFSLGSIRSVTWSPDSKRLAFEFSYEDSDVYLLDATAPGGRLEDLKPILSDEDSLVAPFWRNDGKVVVGSMCCYPDWEKPRANLVVDPATGESAPFSQAEDFSYLDFDRTSRHLLYVKGENGELFRQSEGEKAVFMANDFLEAEW